MPPLVLLVSLGLALPSSLQEEAAGDRQQQPQQQQQQADFHDPVAQLALGKWYAEVDDVPGSDAAAAQWFARAAVQGNAEAQYQLGLLYHRGAGVPHDPEFAIHWLSLAAEQGHAEARELRMNVLDGQIWRELPRARDPVEIASQPVFVDEDAAEEAREAAEDAAEEAAEAAEEAAEAAAEAAEDAEDDD